MYLNMKSLPILMTASVSTRGMEGACFSDHERYNMYLNTLIAYLSDGYAISGSNLVFVDNSGWDLNSFYTDLKENFSEETLKSRVEFISLSPDLFDISKGKGYNELLMINLAIDKSVFINEAGAFFKVTGRYPILNLSRFVSAAHKAFEDGYSFYCDIKSHNLYRMLGLNWNSHTFEARLWGSKVDFYKKNISEQYVNCYDYDGRFVENVLYNELSRLSNDFKQSKEAGMMIRFDREARFGGIEGSTSSAASFSKDQQSFKSRVKIMIGNFFRIFTPWFKF